MRASRCLAAIVATVLSATACVTTPAGRLEVAPLAGQSAEQTDRDRFECGLWAQRETGYEPGRSRVDGTLLGLLAGGALGGGLGAVIGAFTGFPGRAAATGALVAGPVGAPVGGIVKWMRDDDATERAWQACLQGRGYAVR